MTVAYKSLLLVRNLFLSFILHIFRKNQCCVIDFRPESLLCIRRPVKSLSFTTNRILKNNDIEVVPDTKQGIQQ